MKLTSFLFLYLTDFDYLVDCIIDGSYDEDETYGYLFDNLNRDSETLWEDVEELLDKWAAEHKIEIQETTSGECNLEDRWEDFRMVFSYDGKYYAMEYYYSYYEGYECNDIGDELMEVVPVEKTIIVYEPK